MCKIVHWALPLLLIGILVGCGETAAIPSPIPTATSALPTAAPIAPATLPSRNILATVDQFLQQPNEGAPFSGAVLIAEKGKVLVSKGYGLADRAKNIPNTPQTKFRLGSLTKQFTALAVLQLQAQGKLNVQEPVCKYITTCPPTWQPITLHQLLNHTSGIPDLTRFPDYEQTKTTPATPVQLMARFKDKPLDFQPGTKWDYSNSNYIVLGIVIEQVAGQPYAQFLQQQIFGPLQMTNSGYEQDQTQLATGYANAQAEAEPLDMSIPFAAGGLYSTVEDLYRWDQALYTTKLLPQPLLTALFTPYAPIPDSGGMSYGYGWVIGQQFQHAVVNHNGGIEGFVSSINRFPADQVTLIMLSNQQDTNPNLIINGLAHIVFGER